MNHWVIEIIRYGDNNPYDQIRKIFNKSKPGEEIMILAAHRDMHKCGMLPDDNWYLLPDRHEIPKTFSLKQVIQDSLNAICPEVDKDYEEIDFEKAGNLDVSQGFYKFMSLTIEDGYIHAVIKKI